MPPRSSPTIAIAAVALLLAAPAQATRSWAVTCGLPQQDNPILDLMPAGYTGPWPGGGPLIGHLEVRTLHRPHSESGISTEMWILSRAVGWWRLKTIRVHPDDLSKLPDDTDVRQIIESPFLSKPAVVRAGTGGEDVVDAQILALLPNARQLWCNPDAG